MSRVRVASALERQIWLMDAVTPIEGLLAVTPEQSLE
jgi:hypothetical protein